MSSRTIDLWHGDTSKARVRMAGNLTSASLVASMQRFAVTRRRQQQQPESPLSSVRTAWR